MASVLTPEERENLLTRLRFEASDEEDGPTIVETMREAALALQHALEEIDEMRASERARDEDWLRSMRAIDGPLCPKCGGWGVATYGSTATWRGGVGGQVMTAGVCDQCWGSGDAARPWRSWRDAALKEIR